ncbi:hypothetical protein [Sporolactobacillus sp. KGMB 08714]|uniref:hypothetical protein n=1 Tax=Sporolactobacillus sp. KGMB 08714 TaxID=3064704 RepID=UPI002FBE3707
MREALETVAYLAEKHYYIKVYTQNNIYVPASGIGRLYEKRAPSVFSKAILSADLSVTMGSADQEMHNPCDRAVTIDCRDDGVHVIDEVLGEAGLPGPVWHQSLFSLCSAVGLVWVQTGTSSSLEPEIPVRYFSNGILSYDSCFPDPTSF